MNKSLARALGVAALGLGSLACACASQPKPEPPRAAPPSFHDLAAGSGLRELFVQRLDGLISDLDVASDGSSVLVATLPDRERAGGAREYRLRKIDRSGKTRWSRKLESSARAVALSRDGSMSFVSTYDDRLIAIRDDGKRGREVWDAQVTCRPMTIETNGRDPRVLCFHDDDAAPEVAFDVFDWKGKRVAGLPSEGDTLSLRVSHDLLRAAVVSSKGLLTVTDAWSAEVLWKKRFEGEVIDVALAEGPKGAVAVLVDPPKGPREIRWLDHAGKLLATAPAGSVTRHLEFAPGGASLATYGTSSAGQSLAWWERKDDKLTRAWERTDARSAQYPSRLEAAAPSRGGAIAVALDDSEDPAGGTARHSHWLLFGADGKPRANYLLPSGQGSFLYAAGTARETDVAAVASDDGTIALLELAQGK